MTQHYLSETAMHIKHGGLTVYRYTATICGGVGPGVWDRDVTIDAVSIIDAALMLQIVAHDMGGAVVAINQE